MSIFIDEAVRKIKEYIKDKYNGKVYPAAKDFGIPASTLKSWVTKDEKIKRKPKLDSLEKVLSQIKDVFDSETVEKTKQIHIYSVAGAGTAWDYTEEDPICIIQVPESLSFKATFALLVKGDSMYPTIKNEAVVGVKTEEPFIPNEIYAIRLPYEGLSIKRVQINYKEDEYIIKSNNPDKNKFPDFSIPIDTAPYLVLGKVVWIWQQC